MPEGKVRHEANESERPIDLRRLSYKRLPKSAGKNFRQVTPILDQKVFNDQRPVIPDKEVVEAIDVKERRKNCD